MKGEAVLVPTLVLPPRYIPDSIAVSKAAVLAGWAVERLGSWRVPAHLKDQEVVLYGEPLFAAVVAEDLGLKLSEPAPDWLANLPRELTGRSIRFTSLADARTISTATGSGIYGCDPEQARRAIHRACVRRNGAVRTGRS